MTRVKSSKTQTCLWLALWALVVVLAASLRLWQIHLQILMDDEWHALHMLMRASYSEIFLSYGHADHTIPLTLLFRALAAGPGLNEWLMRALPLSFGLASVLLLPLLFRPWLDRHAQWLYGLLLAISPVLIHFSRYVRPYAITITLSVVALMALWRWWHERQRAWAVLFVISATLAAWLHPLTLLFTAAALSWFGVLGVIRALRHRKLTALKRILPLGALTTLMCSALVLPPLLADPAAMSSKAGIHRIELETLLRGWELAAGTAMQPVAWLLAALVLLGGWRLYQRDHLLLAYLTVVCLCASVLITVLNAAWIHHPLVWLRYVSPVIPLVLMLAALGTGWLAQQAGCGVSKLSKQAWPTHASPALLGSLLAFVLWLAGPLPKVYNGLNQFTNHMRYHFDYDFERSVYSYIEQQATLPHAYKQMIEHPGDWHLVEAPWHYEAHHNPLGQYQRTHQMPLRIGMISGLCTPWTLGELRPVAGLEIDLRGFTALSKLLETGPEQPTFVVFHLGTPFGLVRELPDISGCIQAFEHAHGEPWFADQQQVVFKLDGRMSSAD